MISADHDCSPQVIEAARARGLRIITVGRHGDGAGEGIRLVEAAVEGFAQKLTLEHHGARMIKLPLVGEFQIENALVAAGLAIVTGSEPAAVLATLEHLEGAKGRLERVGDTMARRSSSTTPTSRTRWPRRCRRCGLTRNASSSSSSAPAATAMPASVRSWARLRPRIPIT